MLLEVIYGKVKFSGEETTGSSTQGLVNLWHMCHNGTQKYLLGMQHSLLPHFFFFYA
jgi:hypothetical protein